MTVALLQPGIDDACIIIILHLGLKKEIQLVWLIINISACPSLASHFKSKKAVGYYPIATKGVEALEHEQKQHPPPISRRHLPVFIVFLFLFSTFL